LDRSEIEAVISTLGPMIMKAITSQNVERISIMFSSLHLPSGMFTFGFCSMVERLGEAVSNHVYRLFEAC